MFAPRHLATTPSLHVASAKISASAADTVRETSDSASPESDVHTACAMPEPPQPDLRAAQSGPAEIQSADLSWVPGRDQMVRYYEVATAGPRPLCIVMRPLSPSRQTLFAQHVGEQRVCTQRRA